MLNTYLPSLLSAVLVVAGWYIVNKAQANRERRKQIREFASGLSKDLSDLEAVVIKYHTDPRDKSGERQIISKLTRFETACGILPKFVENQRFFKATPSQNLIVSGLVIQQMRKAMTLKHFYDEHSEPLDDSDQLIQGILASTDKVQETLTDVRLASLD
jgi:hypothetical protein